MCYQSSSISPHIERLVFVSRGVVTRPILLSHHPAGSSGGRIRGGVLHVLVTHDASRKFLLRLLETGTSAPVNAVHLHAEKEVSLLTKLQKKYIYDSNLVS